MKHIRKDLGIELTKLLPIDENLVGACGNNLEKAHLLSWLCNTNTDDQWFQVDFDDVGKQMKLPPLTVCNWVREFASRHFLECAHLTQPNGSVEPIFRIQRECILEQQEYYLIMNAKTQLVNASVAMQIPTY